MVWWRVELLFDHVEDRVGCVVYRESDYIAEDFGLVGLCKFYDFVEGFDDLLLWLMLLVGCFKEGWRGEVPFLSPPCSCTRFWLLQ